MWELIFAVVVALISFAVNRSEAEKKKRKKRELENDLSIQSSMKFKRKSNVDMPFESKGFSNIIKKTKVLSKVKSVEYEKNNQRKNSETAFQKQNNDIQVNNTGYDNAEFVDSQDTQNITSNKLTNMILNDRMSAFVAYEIFGPPKSLRKD